MKRLRRALVLAALLTAVPSTASHARVMQDTTAGSVDSSATPAPRPSMILPTYDLEVPDGPLAPGSRYTFTRDSIRWSAAHTLADLLTAIPGVYVARAGFLGLPEYIQYAGRGGSALEIYWDGNPMVPVGGDSLFIDPATIYLRYLYRVEVEVLPARLRVYLVSERHNRVATRSLIRATPGSFRTAAYTGLFQKRWSNGIALDLAAQFVGSEGGIGPDRSDRSFFDIWFKAGWLPTEGVAVSYQLRRQRQDRNPVTATTGGLGVPGRVGSRTDMIFSLASGTAPERLGLRTNAGLTVTKWTPDSAQPEPEQTIRSAFAGLRYVRRSWSAGVRARVSDERTPFAAEGRVGWVPVPGIVLAADAEWRRHENARTSRAVHGSLGLYRGPFSLVGAVAVGDRVQAPALMQDTAISTFDQSVRLGLATGTLTGHVSLLRRDSYKPLPYPDLAVISAMAAPEKATYVSADLLFHLTSALTLSGWYSDPLEGTPADFQPPTHGRWQATLRSKFWRTFPSGAFDFKLQLAIESWSTGTAGLDGSGTPITLPGATFWEYHVEVGLVGFTAFWNLRNARLSNAQYVPGLTYPKNAQTFGVTWVFMN